MKWNHTSSHSSWSLSRIEASEERIVSDVSNTTDDDIINHNFKLKEVEKNESVLRTTVHI